MKTERKKFNFQKQKGREREREREREEHKGSVELAMYGFMGRVELNSLPVLGWASLLQFV